MPPLPSILVADYVDHTARLWVDTLTRSGFAGHACRPIDVRPALLQSYGTRLIVLAVSHLRHRLEFTDLEEHVIPVLVVSANPHDRNRQAEFGCVGVLTRPVSATTLLQRVREILGAPGQGARAIQAEQPSSGLETAAASGSALRAAAERLCAQATLLREQALEVCACSTTLIGRFHANVEQNGHQS